MDYRRATDASHPKWRFIVPVLALVLTAGGLVLSSKYKAQVAAFQVEATVTESEAPKMTATKVPAKAQVTTESQGRTTTLSLDMIKERQQYHTQQRQWLFQAGFSLLMVLASIYIILSKRYPDDVNKWGYSTIAFIMGYWLKS